MDVRVKQSLMGTVAGKQHMQGTVVDKATIEGTICVSLGGVTEQYDGNYAVTPTVDAQVLPTKRKVMIDDLTIKEIPFFEVSNTSGGTTVYIGEEIEYG